jgi:hypothetical protein
MWNQAAAQTLNDGATKHLCAPDCSEARHRVHNGAEYPAVWPAIFTREEWNRIDARRKARAQRWPGRGRQVGSNTTYWPSVLRPMWRIYGRFTTQASSGEWQRRYRCKKYDNYGQIVDAELFRGADPLEA